MHRQHGGAGRAHSAMSRSRRPRKRARVCLGNSRQTMEAQTKMTRQIEIEPIATRVALHPFLAGMNRVQLALLNDCAMATNFKKKQTIFREGEMANRFYLIETG